MIQSRARVDKAVAAYTMRQLEETIMEPFDEDIAKG